MRWAKRKVFLPLAEIFFNPVNLPRKHATPEEFRCEYADAAGGQADLLYKFGPAE